MPVGKTWAELMNEANNAPKTEFKLLDPGTYSFYVKESKAGRDKSGNKDQIVLTVAVEAGERKGATVRHYLTISPESPQALQIFFRELGAMGLDEAFFNSNPNMDVNVISNALVNRRFVAEIKHTTSGDKVYANLDKIAASAGPAPQAGVPGGFQQTAPPAAGPGAGPGMAGPGMAQPPAAGPGAGYVQAPPASQSNPWDQAPPAPPAV